ncbi:non-ribosomal peptide synthase/polyketide synthase [Bacillus thuringiensis]|uniref:Bacitracin synthetase 1 n=9 Tax=Bacillus thuringiensis TaxID=1428 RepID=A0A9W3NWJ9_BACTU|nr:non-ribosomal peptide synthetase [Bacillus thuringiensis]AFQ15020.1 bacitracin synthetase 1 [Bacillus thuringiensis HD-771]MEB4892720.1 non-ribosomal peptide synthase/polyketide synthase [Bacillus thuringiensis]MEC2565332.1 non-ribosomal peptide synthase/polyketide synthase [Bacillus thuringiensis]MEC2724532.1 non-ribosomal peptide synthase/polyketide synthase [Bacillus thuringiensis]MEC2752427.1 non-ribosomal peptide synthase/polyketide synthase [Bacillus thuringiensis]
MRSDLLAKLSSLSPEKRAWLQKQMQKKENKEALPLSYAQQRLWFMDRFNPNSSLYNIPTVWHLKGNWIPEALEKGFNRLIERHESLRTVFKEVGEQPVQQIVEFLPRALPVRDYSQLPLEVKEKEVDSLIAREAQEPFNLMNGPLVRNQLVQLEKDEWLLLCTMHHIISDAWSIGIFMNELLAFYEEETGGNPAKLSSLSIQYADFAKWQKEWLQGDVLNRQLTYWQEELSGELPILQLPVDRPRPVKQTYSGATHHVIFPYKLLSQLKDISRQEGSTLFMTLMAAYQSFLARYTGQKDILVGSPIANRNHKGVEGLIGFFVNTLVYRSDLSGIPTFREILNQTKKKALKAYEYQDIPFEKVVEAVQPERSTSHSPIFQTMFTLQNIKQERLDLPDRSIEMVESNMSIAKFDLSLTAYEVEEGLFVSFEYNTDLFDSSTIARMAGHFENWLNEITYHPDESYTKLSMLSDTEQKQLLEEWNDTDVVYGHDCMIHELFEQQVARTPNAVAVVYEGGKLTYQELNEKSNQLAHFLQKRGIGPESLVGICIERSPDMIIGLFGILKAGGAYVPLDPSYPENRLRYILENSQIQVLLTKEALQDWLPKDIRAICLDRDQVMISKESNLAPVSGVTANNLAYIIYTSGSTGNPKGVMIEHHSVINRLQWMQKKYPLSEDDTFLQKTPFSFDVSVWELFWWSFVGARVCLLPPGGEKDPAVIEEYIERYRVSTMHFVPSMLSTFLDYMELYNSKRDVSSLIQVFTSGEALNTEQVRRFKGIFYNVQQTKLINLYGPTEATVDVTYYDCDLEKEAMLIPIGRPIDNTELYVLDQYQQVVPIGVAGELYLGGVGLARGYFNRPDLTTERFIPHPFKDGERLYRTGDLVRYMNDRNLEYIGRIDNQVKIRGFRIELGEIEAALHDHSSVKEAVVLVKEDRPGDKQLVAYVVGEGDTGEWREYLKKQLPHYMVPAYFFQIEGMPLTPNGKVNRKALLELEEQFISEDITSSRTPVEELIVSVWSQVLGIKNISVQDSFFEIGGHSLLATQVVSRLQEIFQIELPVRELFEYTTVESLAKRLEQLRKGDKKREIPPLIPMERGEAIPLSYAQQRLWFIDQFTPNSALYNMPMVCRLTGNWLLEALETGWNQLIERHESLRTVFQEVNGQPVQQIKSYAFQSIPKTDLTMLSSEDREEEVKRFIQQETEVPFDLTEGPLIRTSILHVGEEEWILLCTLHHIISDGWSMGILLEEWMAFYEKATDGKVAELEPLPVQYADFAQWQKGWLKEEVLDQQLQYWREELSGELPVLQLPMDRPRPAIQTHHGSTYTLVLPSTLHDKLNELSRKEGATLFMTLLAAYQSFLSRYTGQEDILVGSPIANRNYREIEGLIGFFVNTLVYRTNLSGGPTFQDVLYQVRQKALKAYEYQDIPFEKIVEVVQPERSTSHSPIFQTMFILQNMKQEFPVLSSRSIEMIESHSPIAKFDLSVMAVETEEGLLFTFEYNKDLFNATTIERMAGHFEKWLYEVSHRPQNPLHDLSMLSEPERNLLLETWNDTVMEMSHQGLICERFEEQVAMRPDAIAIVDQTKQWTYGELDIQANQLANVLQRKGVAPESVVGVYLPRSAELMASLLGILKAGGAYVVLDPLYPKSRLEYMIEDAGIQFVVTAEVQEGHFAHVEMVRLEELTVESVIAPTRQINPENLAYIVYTSGSTGKPKGVMVEYRSLMNMVSWHQEVYRISAEDCATQIAGVAFDSAVQEIWPYLTAGAALYLSTEELRINPEALRDWLIDSRITASFAPTPILERLLKLSWPDKTDLRFIITGGDQLTQYPSNDIPFAVINQYGPSENTVVTTDCYVPVGVTTGTPSIGRPIANTEVYVLDSHLQLVPIGVIGDLYIGGKSLARGYANRPDLTKEKFIPHPFKSGERLYYTGDKASYLSDGNLQFHGRIDDQVKIRGFRIELGEIEAVLQAHSSVKEAVVLVREDNQGDKRLVAYVVGEGSVHEWREHLQTHLPNYMVPTNFIEMEFLPLTPNGKLDLKALPILSEQSAENTVYPRTPLEELIASVWSQVLGIRDIDVQDSFFELGGHSLLATQVVSRLQEVFQIKLPVRELFEYSTVEALSKRIDQLRKGSEKREIPPLMPIERGGNIPLSYAQQRLWFIDQFAPNSALYNMPMACRLTGNWLPEALELGWNQLIERHESLRTVFYEEDGHPIQQIQPYVFRPLLQMDLTKLSLEERERKLEQWIQTEVESPFDLEQGPLFRGKLIRISEEEWILLCNMHHIISDGWSMEILLQEWMAFYENAIGEKQAELEPLPVQYADFAQWQREWLKDELLYQQLAYWKEELSGELPVLMLPMDRPRPPVQTHHGLTHNVLLSRSLLDKLNELSRQEGATLFMTLLAAYQSFLARYTGQTDIIVGSPIANRNYREIEGLIGFFVNTLVYRADLSNAPAFQELLSQVRIKALKAYEYQDVPFEKIVEVIQPERNTSHSPIFQTMFTLQNTGQKLPELHGRNIEVMESNAPIAKFDLSLTAAEVEEGLLLTFVYRTDLFDSLTIESMAEHFGNWLNVIVENPDKSLAKLPILSGLQQKQLEEWNNDAVAYPQESTIHQLFEEQVNRTPDAVAVVDEKQQLTYRELNEKANQLAHYLQQCGIGNESLVGLCFERSVEMVVSIMGIWKAGAAYVPLDPSYPESRLRYILEDTGIQVLVTNESLEDWIPKEMKIVCLDRDQAMISQESILSPKCEVTGETLAYVIYTSGSTGNPKGVLIQHHSVLNLSHGLQKEVFEHEIPSNMHVGLNASIAFDASIQQLQMLLYGSSLYIIPNEVRSDPEQFVAYIRENKLEIFDITPSLLQLLIDVGLLETCDGIHVPSKVLVGGEAIMPSLWEQLVETDKIQFYNVYGPTECTVDATCYHIKKDSKRVTIGRPLPNVQTYVLDRNRLPVPVGVMGELYIGGAGLARGYLNRPELTSDRFISHPFKEGERLYRTGDLVRYLPDGNIDYLGRMDNQVKIRGFRIELGEIESTLQEHDLVKEVVVIVRENQSGDKRLVAYVVGEGSLEEWREYLKTKLPIHMIPSYFVEMKELPLTINGKVDRKSLPIPDYQGTQEGYAAPRNEREHKLSIIWERVLGSKRIGIYDNFFEIGGDSILSIQIVSRAKQAGLQLTPKQLFEHQTIAELAQVVKEEQGVQAEQGIITGETILTPIQQRFFAQNHPNPHHWNQSMFFRTKEKLDIGSLEKAARSLLLHHDALRLRYERLPNGTWEQWNEGIKEQLMLTVISLDEVPEAYWHEVIQKEINVAQERLNLHDGPLMRMVYFDEDEKTGRLFWTIHHLAVDGVSWRILLEDLQTAYTQAVQGQKIQLPMKSTSFKEWSEKLQHYAETGISKEVLHYWEQQAEQDVVILPVDGTISNPVSAVTEEITVVLNENETRMLLQETLSTHRVQINEVLLAALVQATAACTGQPILSVDLEGHGREEIIEDVDLSRTVGWFTSIYPVHLNITNANTPIAALKAVKEQVRKIPNKGVDYGVLCYMNATMCEQLSFQYTPSISFNYLGQFDQLFSSDAMFIPENEFKRLDHAAGSKRSHVIDVIGVVTDGKLQFTWVYNVGQFAKSTIQSIAQNMLYQLSTLIQFSDRESALTISDFAMANLSQEGLTNVLNKMHRGKNNQITDLYPLSPLQEGMIFHTLHDQGDEHVAPYIVQLSFMIRGKMNIPTFEQAWKSVIQRHEIFRTAFVWDEIEEPVQVVYENIPFKVNKEDWRTMTSEEIEEKRKVFLELDRKQAFQFDEAPLMRVTVIQEGEEEYRIVWTHHHILLDGWSLPLVFNELLTVYQKRMNGEAVKLPKSSPYKKYIQWLREQDKEQAEQFWREKLKGFTAPTLLGLESKEGEKGYTEKVTYLSEEQTQALQGWAKRNKLTLSTVIQGAWAYLMSRYSGENDIVFGVTSSGRSTEIIDVENIVGPFITTSPTRIQLMDDIKLIDWLQKIQEEEIERRQYEYASLTEIQAWSEVPRGIPLFNSLYVFENYPVKEESSENLEIGELEGVEQTHYPLGLAVVPGIQLSLKLMYDRSKFNRVTIERMLGHLHKVLMQMLKNIDQNLSELVYITEAEQRKLLEEWNNNTISYPRENAIHQLFEEQVNRTPDALAVVDEKQQLTYRELNERANQLAHHLQKCGIGTESLVGLCFDRSVEMVVGLMGIWKAGAAYVPLDPSNPESRLRYILEDTGIKVLVTNEVLLGWIPKDIKVVCLDRDQAMISRESKLSPTCEMTGENLAYVIYTSGSTGNPKGALVQHHSVINLSYGLQKEVFSHEIPSNMRVGLNASIAFDVSIQQLQMLLYGSSLYIIPSEVRTNPEQFVSYIRENKLEMFDMTPSLLQLLIDGGLLEISADVYVPSKILVGGEAIMPSLWEQLVETEKIDFYNVYGPTECTVDATCYHIKKDSKRVTIGRPLPNVQTYVLDKNLLPVPVGVTGELYIGGAGIARGYLNRPELTAERFIRHPFNEEERLYRTGDLVRYLPDGNLDYLRRIDNQVKIRGFRIELEEIEANLESYPLVKEAVVLVTEDKLGEQRLVAYVVGDGSMHDWREYLKTQVPNYMVPAHFIKVDEIPLTTNGKVDRKALNNLTILRENNFSTPIIPRDEIEYQLIKIWQDVLQIEDVYVNDDFFNRGGHSLLVIKLVSKIREKFGKEIKVSTLIKNPTVEGIACLIRDKHDMTKSVAALVPLQESEKRPFFCVHPFMGNVFCYIQLARLLKSRCSFYGLQNPLIEKKEIDELTLPEVIQLYIEEIKRVQPEGPYRLGGWSLGGAIAYEIATVLKNQGEEVELLVLMDTKVPSKQDHKTSEDMLSYIYEHFIPRDLTEQEGDLVHKQDMLVEQLIMEGVLTPDADLINLKQVINAHRKCLNLMVEHDLIPYSGEVLYFSAEEGKELFTDWGPLLKGRVNRYSVPGSHEEIVDSPAVEKIAMYLLNEFEGIKEKSILLTEK